MRVRSFHRPLNIRCPQRSEAQQIKIRTADLLNTNRFQPLIERCCAERPPLGTVRVGGVELPLPRGWRQQVTVVTECNPRCLRQPNFIISSLVLFGSLPVVSAERSPTETSRSTGPRLMRRLFGGWRWTVSG
jgi:hypothetical protein